MPAETIELPNLRKMFIPDPGYTIIDADLEKADAQVVAWEANDDILKQMFREHVNIHEENAKVLFNVTSPTALHYHKAKQGVHAVNYGVQARTLADTLGITVREAESFISRWFAAHPAIVAWHARIDAELRMNKVVRNKFGFRCYFLDRYSPKLLHEALAWVPQSTVALVTNKGLLNIENNLPEVELLLQIHDSLLMQAPTHLCPEIYPKIRDEMLIPIPYEDPLTIPVNLAVSEKSWGDIEEYPLAA